MSDPRLESDDLLARISSQSHPGTSNAEVQDLIKKKELQLSEIRRLQEQLARESEELEEFTQRKEELSRALEDMLNRFHRSMILLERSEFEEQRTIEEIRQTREKFQLHLDELSRIEGITWSSINQKKDLQQAISLVDTSREDFNQAQIRLSILSERRKIDDENNESLIPGESNSFRKKVRDGFAQNLVLILSVLFLAVVIYLKQP